MWMLGYLCLLRIDKPILNIGMEINVAASVTSYLIDLTEELVILV